jgi:hypothetical protein
MAPDLWPKKGGMKTRPQEKKYLGLLGANPAEVSAWARARSLVQFFVALPFNKIGENY